MMKIAGSGSESISQRHGSADSDPDPDPHQNVMDPQHWFKLSSVLFLGVLLLRWTLQRLCHKTVHHIAVFS